MNKKARTRLIVATGVIVVVFVIGVVFLVQKQGAYYRQVSELATGQYDGKNVKVGGTGARRHRHARRLRRALHHQDLTGKPNTVDVPYSGQMPNTFDAGVDVVVIGEYATRRSRHNRRRAADQVPDQVQGVGSLARSPVDEP